MGSTTVRFPPLDLDDLGTDVALTDDLATVWGIASGKTNLAMAYYRRLTTPAGGLFYDRTYGYDVRELVNADLDEPTLSAARGGIKAQLMLDERTQSVDVDLTFSRTAKALKIAVFAETDAGPFTLVLRATGVTLDVLEIDGLPAPAAITPDIVRPLDAEPPADIVFPPAPPAIGALSGTWNIGLNFQGALTQPPPDGFLMFAGMAGSSGSDQTHASYGATTSAPGPSQTSDIAYLPPAITVRGLRVNVLVNTRTVSTTFTLYKNGSPATDANGNAIQIGIGSLTTGVVTDAHAVAFNGTTDVLSLVSSGSPTGYVLFGATLETGTVRVLKFSGNHSQDVGEFLYHADVPGFGRTNPVSYIPPACTISGLRVNVRANASAFPMDVIVYKNGVATSMKVTVPAFSTAAQIDITGGHAVSLNGTTDRLDLVSSRPTAVPVTDEQFYGASSVDPANSNYTWTRPGTKGTVEVTTVGGGGGSGSPFSGSGGGGSGGGASLGGGGGGGAGGCSHGTFDLATMPATVSGTCGAIGLGGGPASSGTPGTDGGDSTFGGFLTPATGGRAGGLPPTGSGGGRGAGGAGGTGNNGTGGAGGSGGDNGDAGAAPNGLNGTGWAPGGGGGGAGASAVPYGGAGGSSGLGGATGGAGGASTGASGSVGTTGVAAYPSDKRAWAGGGSGGGASGGVVSGLPGGNGAPGSTFGAGAGGAGRGIGTPSGVGANGGPGFVHALSTVLPGDVSFTATLEAT